MGFKRIKPLITSFTREGVFLAVLSSDGIVRIWNTKSGNLQAEWKDSDEHLSQSFSCMACNYIGKKHKKEGRKFLLVIGTEAGNIMAIDVFTSEKKWTTIGCHPGGIRALSFANKGETLHSIGADGMVNYLDSETGEILGNIRASKKSLACFALSDDDEKIATATRSKIRIFSLQSKKELHHFSVGAVQNIVLSNDGKFLVSYSFGENQLQLCECNEKKGNIIPGVKLSLQDAPIMLECKGSYMDGGISILSLSKEGICSIWNLESLNQKTTPAKIEVKSFKKEDLGKNSKEKRVSIIAAKINQVKSGGITVLVAFGPTTNLQFHHIDVIGCGKDVFLSANDGQVIDKPDNTSEAQVMDDPLPKKGLKKKRTSSDPDVTNLETVSDSQKLNANDEVVIDDDLTEPTMGEKLASLNLLENDSKHAPDIGDFASEVKAPSADSVHVLLKQALHADDSVLLLDCLRCTNEQVISNSISRLNPSDSIKFLNFLVSLMHSRGGVMGSAILWLRSLILQHAGSITSQKSSLLALNSLYQVIDSRVSTFSSALQLSSYLDFQFAGIIGDEEYEEIDDKIEPIIYEDEDSSEEGSEDEMEVDEQEEEPEATIFHDSDGHDSLSE